MVKELNKRAKIRRANVFKNVRNVGLGTLEVETFCVGHKKKTNSNKIFYARGKINSNLFTKFRFLIVECVVKALYKQCY